ncbi:hypothetical protein BAUCODRAFT_316743 [Baudoinia panamericana UAMH 10762]|uniref:dolichol kinase n=1 Tax=Baudoinia panamericana (strain UAMH 10762) TaxID=717646 RepID=M2M3M4_BAUPA|nr:uncharacterized protein BAUCODRAFT_316743 [Baudoinia panamericana UAMH 10762]EMC91156.1 hypothetical protein BAUCODRAFT_316743 [Baudoinia panamericana UAMH 10762]
MSSSSTARTVEDALTVSETENLRTNDRTPRPYFHDGVQVRQDRNNRGDEHFVSDGNATFEQAQGGAGDNERYYGRSGQRSIAQSESGTEADDEGPSFARALPAPALRPRKGLKTGESNEDALLTPSQLDDEGRRLSEGYFEAKTENKKPAEADEMLQQKLLRRRFGEFARRSSEVALMGVILVCVLCGHGVLRTVLRWRYELLSHVLTIATLILAYPVKLSVVDTRAQHIKLWQRFRVPASFDPATVLYPPLLPVLIALLVSPMNEAVILPNIILGLASLPQRLFPRSSRLGCFNAVHWFVSIIPLILAEHKSLLPWQAFKQPYGTLNTTNQSLTSEALVSLYPLHHALLPVLHYLTTTSLLMSELHLLSVALINLLLLSVSPQMIILKACLWIGGVVALVFCKPVLNWNITLARVPKWKLRRPGHTAEERRSLVDAVTDLINLQRTAGAFKTVDAPESDADEDEPRVSMKAVPNGVPKLHTRRRTMVSLHNTDHTVPMSATEPRSVALNNLVLDGVPERPRTRRNTLPGRTSPLLVDREPSRRRKPRSKLLWVLQLTPEQARRRKWVYAAYIYSAIAVSVVGPVRYYVQEKALHGYEPVGWAVSYLFGQIPLLRNTVKYWNAQFWVPLPELGGDWRDLTLSVPLAVKDMRDTIGIANMRLLLFAYWVAVIGTGLLTVFSLTAYVEVDTRRKVFHGVMVAVLLPSIFIDPCYCALGLALVLTVFLLLEIIRAGQVAPLGSAISKFVAPYVDGRDLRGPVVVSHIFLLIGCAIPLWASLASIQRVGGRPWTDWELAENQREVAMLAGVICVGMGDAAASLIGRRYGRHKWIWVGGKSLEGSAAFAVAVTVGLMAGKAWQVLGSWSDTVKPLEGHLGRTGNLAFAVGWFVSLVKALFCACAASFMEAVLTGANDNVVVPVALWLLVKGSRL